jgi:serpin B
LAKIENRAVRVVLPKFKLETDYDLGENLKQMGMVQAFQEREANFKGMSKSILPDDNLSIGKVLHKAFVEVNEEGTEAAAATAVIMVAPTSALPPGQRFTPEFRGDRPFLFLIREVESGAILFFGRVNSPKA